MGRVFYLLVLGFIWALMGVATNAHKGAVFAAVVGLFWMIFMAIGFIITWDDTESRTPVARVFFRIAVWVSFPVALLAWGNKSVDGGGALWIIFWFTAVAVGVRLLALAGYGVNKKWGY